MNDPETLAAGNGFSHWAQLNMTAAVPMTAVRDMCAADRCGRFGHNWACPPGCGSIETAARHIARYDAGILVQTTGTLRDDFDYASIEGIGRDAHDRAYIPGSSLKGALRTVWLLQAVRADRSTGHSLASDDNAAFPEEQYVNQLHLRLQEDGSIASDAVNSLFRGVQVSDSKPIPNEQMALCGKFDALPDGSFPKNSKKGLPLFRECAIPGAKVRFKLTWLDFVYCTEKEKGSCLRL